MNYYNEFNPKAAAALRQLIADGLIPNGDVDERSITEVRASDLTGYTQCHFFAGIGGWSYALQLAGWPTDKPVWTGSCPCQPFSTAGKQKGKEDSRHLWPVWFSLIRQSRPPVVFGEQVSAAIRHHWWDDVADDLEREGYTTRAEIRPACSVGAPHKRDRLWFVGNAKHTGSHGGQIARCNGASVSNNTQGADSTSEPARASEPSNVADSTRILPQRCQDGQGQVQPWGNGTWIDCPDGKQRLVEPSICLLSNGVSERVGLLSAAGNAIVPQVAAEFIKAVRGE